MKFSTVPFLRVKISVCLNKYFHENDFRFFFDLEKCQKPICLRYWIWYPELNLISFEIFSVVHCKLITVIGRSNNDVSSHINHFISPTLKCRPSILIFFPSCHHSTSMSLSFRSHSKVAFSRSLALCDFSGTTKVSRGSSTYTCGQWGIRYTWYHDGHESTMILIRCHTY